MELNVNEQTEKLQAENAKLQVQLQQLEQARNNVIATILGNNKAMEVFKGLDGDRPKEC